MFASFESPLDPSSVLPSDFFAVLAKLSSVVDLAKSPATSWCMSSRVEGLQFNHTQQHWWTDLVYDRLFIEVSESLSVRNRVRLLCHRQDYAGAWLHAIPSEPLGLSIPSAEFLSLVKWRLGIPLLPYVPPSAEGSGPICVDCSRCVDVLGDHFVSCRKCGFWKRHATLCSSVSHIASAARLGVQLEVPVGGLQRPADIMIYNLEAVLPYVGQPLTSPYSC